MFDACHEMAEEVDETNVRDATCEFYECDCAGYGTPGGDACWQEEGVRLQPYPRLQYRGSRPFFPAPTKAFLDPVEAEETHCL